MSYLLDTHAFLWAITDKSKLSALVRQTIENTDNEVSVSAISFWEVSLKYAAGKLDITGFSPAGLPGLAIKSGFSLSPVLPEDTSTYHLLPPVSNHKDPFDKMLIWLAIRQNLVLITKDKNIEQYSSAGLKTLW